MNHLKSLAGQTAIYGLSSIIGRMLNYLLFPLYTYVFARGEFGIFVELYSYLAFLLIILTHGMETAFFRFRRVDTDQPLRRDESVVFSTSLFSVASLSALFMLSVLVFRQPLAEMLHYGQHSRYILWLGIVVSLDAINAVPFARLRAQNRAFLFALIKLAGITVNILVVLFFLLLCPFLINSGPEFIKPFISVVYNPETGIGYVFLANLAATVFTSLLLLPLTLRGGFSFDRLLWGRMIVYALPLLVVGLAGVVNEALDKLLLRHMLPAETAMEQVGIYGACYKLSVLMTIFIQAFRFAAEPFFFSHSSASDARQTYAMIMKYFVAACLMIFLGIMLFIDIAQLLIGPEYREGITVVPILLMANMMLGIYLNLSIWYKLTGQTRYGALIGVAGALITIVLNVLLIPRMGYMGSAWTTLACYVFMTLMSYFLGQRHYPVPYESRRILTMILLALGIWGVRLLFTFDVPVLGWLLNLGLIGCFALGLWLIDSRFFTRLTAK